MKGFLFDDMGRLRASAALWRALAPQLSAEAFLSFAVRNMGFVAVEERRSGIRVRLRARVVGGTTQGALFQWLADRPAQRVLVNADDGRPPKICNSAQAAIGYLAATITAGQLDTSELRRSRRPVETLPAGHPFAALGARWRSMNGVYKRDAYEDLLNGAFADRYIVVAPARSTGDMVVREAGSGFSVLNPTWMAKSAGRRVSDQPDVRFGHWASQAYSDALAERVPTLETIDVVISQPLRASTRVSYQRMILPCREAQDRVLLGASLVDRSVVLAR